MKTSGKILIDDILFQAVSDVACRMLLAARTAPKGRGRDTVFGMIVHGDVLAALAAHMTMMGERDGQQFFIRDAACVLKSQAVVLLGTSIKPLGLSHCGLCGFGNCEGKNEYPLTPCVFNTHDLGVAIGSAVSLAADNRIDNRIMFSAGMAAREMKLFEEDLAVVFGIPLSVSGKSPFFDRS